MQDGAHGVVGRNVRDPQNFMTPVQVRQFSLNLRKLNTSFEYISTFFSRGHFIHPKPVVMSEVKDKEQKVDPWTAHAAEGAAKIDYDKLIGKVIIKSHIPSNTRPVLQTSLVVRELTRL